MIKKIVKYALCFLIVLGVAISIVNFFQPELHSVEFPKLTYDKTIPDCVSPEGGCNDMTSGSKG